jgi:hypothetical protein
MTCWLFCLNIINIGQSDHIGDLHEFVGQSSLHCGRDAKGLVYAHPIVVHKIYCQSVTVVLDFLGERIGQPRKTPVAHSNI